MMEPKALLQMKHYNKNYINVLVASKFIHAETVLTAFAFMYVFIYLYLFIYTFIGPCCSIYTIDKL